MPTRTIPGRSASPVSLRDHGHRPFPGTDQPGGQRPHDPVPGVLGRADHDGVRPRLGGRAVQLYPRVSVPYEALNGASLSACASSERYA